MTFFISRKRYSIGEVLKCIFFRNPGIAKVLAVERDVKPQNMNFAKVDRRGGGGVTNREEALIRINMVSQICLFSIHFLKNFPHFSSSFTFYFAQICSPTTYFTSSWHVLKCGFPKFGLFFRKAWLLFVVVNANPQLLQIFSYIAAGCLRDRLQ